MNFKSLFAALILISGFGLSVMAQKNHAREAWVDYGNEKYYDAKEKFKIAAEKERKVAKKAELYYMAGECYRQILQPDKAEFFYNKAIEGGYTKSADIYWHLAEAQREQATDKGKDKYEAAQKSFMTYFEKSGDTRGKEMAESCKRAIEWIAKPTRHIIENETVINTENFDFSPVFIDRKNEVLVFTSSRPASTGSNPDPHTGDFFTDLYQTNRDKKGKFLEPQLMGGGINTAYNEGAAVLDSRKTTMYFTRCPFEKKQNLGCDICETELKGKTWGTPKVLSELKKHLGEGGDSVTVGHPALTGDNKSLIFASDMPDGQGGRDLWISHYDNRAKEWGKPENLGPQINTKGDEMFPYISPTGDLYFASNGHPGMGGLDMFRAKQTGDKKWGEVENLKYPMNSPQHDFGLILDGTDDRGYFTSNRTVAGAKGRDDIYSFVLPPLLFSLTVEVTDLNEKPIQEADITLVGTDGSSYTVKSNETGKYNFLVQNDKRYINENTSYTIEVKHKKYVATGVSDKEVKTSAVAQITTVGQEKSLDFYKVFRLQAIAEKKFHMPVIMFEYDKAFLMVDESGDMKGNDLKRPLNSKDSLNYLFDMMKENPNWVVRLRAHTDARGNAKYNEKLSQRRAQACVDYLVKEKGIDPKRLVALGMGKREPLPGLSEAEIKALPTKEQQEAAHMRNRRVDFMIISTEYVPEGQEEETPKPE